MHRVLNRALDYLERPSYYADVYAGNVEAVEKSLRDQEQRDLINFAIPGQANHTVIFIACYGASNVATLKCLIDCGANLDIKNYLGRNLWHYAANAADPNILLFLSERLPKDKCFLPDKSGRTALHALCCSGLYPAHKRRGVELIKSFNLLLSGLSKAGVLSELNRRDRFGFSALHYANYYGYSEIFEVVSSLEKDLDTVLMPPKSDLVIPNDHPAVSVDFFGRTKLQNLVCGKNTSAVEQEIMEFAPNSNPTIANPHAGYWDALHYAVFEGTASTVQAILSTVRTNTMSRDSSSRTALHLAAYRGNPYILQVLLSDSEIQSNINATDRFGMTALHVLAMTRVSNNQKIAQLDCLETLMQLGIDQHIKDNNGKTAKELAMNMGNDFLAANIDLDMALERIPIYKQGESLSGTYFIFTGKLANPGLHFLKPEEQQRTTSIASSRP